MVVKKMSENTHNEISVDVETTYIEAQSRPDEDYYMFAYTITIHNRGTTVAQLLSRHWIITDANGQVQEVRGDGVIGQQPLIRPGETFSYTSGTTLKTPVGSMHGSYQMRSESGDHFDTPIHPFSLATPKTLH